MENKVLQYDWGPQDYGDRAVNLMGMLFKYASAFYLIGMRLQAILVGIEALKSHRVFLKKRNYLIQYLNLRD